jgi:plasmid stabilization system protein ParE
MKSRVIITKSAEADADEIYEWLRERSLLGATNWWNAFLRAVEALRKNAGSYGHAAESREIGGMLREHLFKTKHGNAYRIVFITRDEVIHVLRVRSYGQTLLTRDEIEFPT